MKRSTWTAGLLVMLAWSTDAFAGAATDVVKAKQSALAELVRQGGADAAKKITAVMDGFIDYQKMAESALGTEWVRRTAAEQTKFTDLLKQLVRKAYEKNLKKTLDYNIEYLAEAAAGGDGTTVKTKAVSKTDARAEPIEINFKMVNKIGWRMHDIVTEGVSLIASYRSQFTKIIKKDGFPALIQKMKDKLAKGDV